MQPAPFPSLNIFFYLVWWEWLKSVEIRNDPVESALADLRESLEPNIILECCHVSVEVANSLTWFSSYFSSSSLGSTTSFFECFVLLNI